MHVRKLEYSTDGNKDVKVQTFMFDRFSRYIKKKKYIFDSYVLLGKANLDTLCTMKSIAFVNAGKESRFNARLIGNVLAHELGHNFGLEHVSDLNPQNCTCHILNPKYCIMYAVAHDW
ncbi:hypothetical protein HZS_853 [Henneguya salminicola]|nr:hypothetical protein HZS_853 [Henneguya salminicola]